MFVNKEKLIKKLVELQKKNGLSRATIAEVVQSIFDHMVITIQRRKKFSYPNFGSFVLRKRKKRIGRNPKTGSPMMIQSRKTILFRPSRDVKNTLNSK